MSGESPPLPGPGLDVPVDTDGDGLSTYGDRYAFNYWLDLGGSLDKALSAAVITGSGIVDLSAFFSSSDAVLSSRPPLVTQPAAQGGAGAQAGGCPTSARIVPPFGAPTTPASLFAGCRVQFDDPTGFDIDRLQRLWCSLRGDSGSEGVTRVDLSQAPPDDFDGTIPVSDSRIDYQAGILQAEDIVVREDVAGIHALVTVPTDDAIWRIQPAFAFCKEVDPSSLVVPPPPVDAPFGLDVVRSDMPLDFGFVGDVVFSDVLLGPTVQGRIQSGFIDVLFQEVCLPENATVTTLAQVQETLGVALGDFNGAGVFATYFIAERSDGIRDVRRLVSSGGGFSDQFFASLSSSTAARSLEFDPISGDLFVSEEGAQARIFRLDENGVVRLFGDQFNEPNGIAFHPSGVMLVSEDTEPPDTPPTGSVRVVEGWRNLFKRGDANGDGKVNISDPQFIWNWISQGGPVPPCLDGADADDNSMIEEADGNRIFDYLFGGGAPPADPGPNTCGRDPTPDLLDCIKSLGAGCAIQ